MWYFNNGSHRQDLDATPNYTIRFKTLFPDFATFQKKIGAHPLINDQDFSEITYEWIEGAIYNSYLRFNTEDKNIAFIQKTFFELKGIMDREKVLYNTKLEDLLKAQNISKQTFFEVNRSETDAFQDKFVSNAIQNEIETTLPQIQVLNEWKQILDLPNPILTFNKHFAERICAPTQPLRKGY